MTRKRNIKKLRHTQGCMTDCVAYFFNVHPESVPFFVYPREGWSRRFKNYFKRRGYAARWLMTSKVPRRGTHLVVGDSLKWKTASHMVVYRNGKLAYDPTYPSKWSDKRITHRLVVRKIKT